jgi:hypothetical protein
MLGKEYPWTILFIAIMVFDIILSYTIALGFIIATLKHLKSMRHILGESTYKMQKQLIFSLILQVILENKANF